MLCNNISNIVIVFCFRLYIFLYLLAYVFIFGFCSVSSQYVFFEKKMYSLVLNNRYPPHPLVRVFFNFCYSVLSKTFFKSIYLLCFVCVWKRMVIFFISVCFAFLLPGSFYQFRRIICHSVLNFL